ELSDRVRSTAGALAAQGAGPGTPVGLCLGRSRLAVPGLLAIWWLGASAVLIDNRHPADRLSFVLRDADVQVVLADRLAAGVAPRRARMVHPEARGVTAGQRVRPTPEACAYVVYTSGTTGWPKGVEVT